MYLKKLDMYGFKSFVDKISLDFVDGITGIVGPNGSGKSNISDAIRWVLGEQSVKSLRGNRMEDVIFAGTEKRKPLNFAEVTLTLDNSEGFFPSEYSELTVTRRVFRNGDSEYYLNKNQCRLRDVHEMFMDTGLGRDGYSVIGQGKIDEILSSKSEDRREIFEEAAGISKHKYKKAEATRKLCATEDNLVRARDIYAELDSRVGPLKEQSEKARKYLDLREELKKLEVNLSLDSISRLRETEKKNEERYVAVGEQIAEIKARLEKMQTEQETLFSEMRFKEDEIEQLRERQSEAEEMVLRAQNDILLIENSIKNAQENTLRTEVEKEELKKKVRDLSQKREGLYGKTAETESAKKERECQTESISAKIDRLSTKMHEQNIEILNLQNEELKILRQQESAKSSISGIDSLSETLEKRLWNLEQETALSDARMNELAQKKEQSKKELETAESRKKLLENEALTGIAKRESLLIEAEKLKSKYNDISAAYNKTMSRLQALKEMEATMEGYAKGVRAVLCAGELLKSDIRGTLSKLISVPDEYVTAIEIAAGNALQNVVVGNENDAKTAIEYLKKTGEGRATFLPVSTVSGKRLDFEEKLKGKQGYLGLACDFVSSDSEYGRIVLNVLGRIAVCDNFDNAIKLAKEFSYTLKTVTLSGELIASGGSVSGGSRAKNAMLIGRNREIERLENEAINLEKDMDKADADIDENADILNETLKKIEATRLEISDAESKLFAVKNDITTSEALAERESDHKKGLIGEADEVRSKMGGTDSEKTRLAEIRENADKQLAELGKQVDEAKNKLRELALLKEQESGNLVTVKLEFNSVVKDAEALEDAIKSVTAEIERANASVQVKNVEREKFEDIIKELTAGAEKKKIDAESAQTAAANMREDIKKRQEDKETARAEADETRNTVKEQNEILYVLQGEHIKLESSLQRIKENADGIIRNLWENYELTLSAAEARKSDVGDIKEAGKRAQEIKKQMRVMGNINLDSIDEYAEVRERYEFMTVHIADLEKAKSELEKIITEVTRVMRDIFREQFAVINESFKETFEELFGGGYANLYLSDPDNVLDSGIEIEVQPPGKKLQSLGLLSGGEKALTAIALLFAILKVRPTPFCILDEIEAALDDGNIVRFAEYLKKYSAETQFIIVTHRRGTMEAANVLYGVTMQEKGVSRMLTMRLDEVKV